MYVKASHKTNLPSASVFRTSIVCPDIDVTTSPGFVALPAGIFSESAIVQTKFTGSFEAATAHMVPITDPAPDISHFISSILGLGFRLIPPVSKVTPFPTSTIGFAPFFPPLYSMVTNFAGSTLPLETDNNEPIPNFSISFSSRTSTENPPISFASSLT